MAKQRISNYVFLPGVASSSNAYPNAYTLLTNNKEFIKAETVAYINAQITADNNQNLYPNAVTLLTNNKIFLQDEILAWIYNTYVATATTFTASTGRVTTSANHPFSVGDPVVFASSAGGVTSGTTYYVLTVPTTTTFTLSTTKNDSTTQVTLTDASSQSIAVRYTYNQTSCRRDTGYLIDAVIYDIRYGGNEQTINICKNFWQGGVLQLLTPGIEEAGFSKLFDIITTNILPKVAYSSQQSPITSTQNTSGTASEAGAITRITTVTTGLKSIISNAITGGLSGLPATEYSTFNYAGYIYDSEKCYRDIGYVIDAYLNDLRYGGNIQTRYISSRFWKGEIPQLSGDRKPEITAQTWIKNLINNTILPQASYLTPYQTSVSRYTNNAIVYEGGSIARITSLADSLIGVLTNGLSSLPTISNGVTTIKLLGRYTLDQLLLITNITSGTILYNFSDDTHLARVSISTGYVSNDYWQDDDYPSFRNTADYVTSIILDYDTSTSLTTDDVQVFIEQPEQRVRPYDFGTDAIERHRVAQPQSMLDADFEYGLQPTKWQAIGLSRGYPSVYEIPGTDTSVSNVTTDASTGTGGTGESLITVTTVGPHGFIVGQPFTIKSLANSVSGFARAEGTFIVNTIPSTTTFTYYAQAKVGSTNGQVLATTYTQLRKAAFYTGASINSPAFSVYTNGISGSITSKWVTSIGSDQIAFTGTTPVIGSPINGTGIASGAQITGVVGTGGQAATATLESDVDINDTSITVISSTGIVNGMAIDNGSGTSIFVSNIVGNTITFTGPITNNRIGNIKSYTNISGSNILPAGVSAIFNVSVVGNIYNSVSVVIAGSGYEVDDQILISGIYLGGTSPENDLLITVTTVDITGSILTVTWSGTTTSSDFVYNGVSGTNVNPIGSGATFNITRSAGSYSVTLNNGGFNYVVGDKIKILGTSFDGTTTANDAIITVTTVDSGVITSVTISGTAVSGETIDFWSSIAISEITNAQITDNFTFTLSAIATIQITFISPHGLLPGSSIITTINSIGSNHSLAQGPFFVDAVPNSTTIRYSARAAGTVDTSITLTGVVYCRSDSYFIHRPYDGGVQLGTGGPQHGAQAIRMSKKYIRYQSGKGINYCTGALFAPSFGIQNISASGTSIGSYITVVTDDTDHGCQIGGVIEIHGIETRGYNGIYRITDIINEREFKVQATSVLSSTVGVLSASAQMSLVKWHGATVRAGTFDDQNGLYMQYDGQRFAVGRRSSTFQLAGTVNVAKDSNLVTGTNTRFRDQIKAGDRIIIRGMTHIVTKITSQSSLTVNPDYRGNTNAVQAKVCLIQDFIIPQNEFNLDKIDGTGPSGYNLDITKMQMIGMQWSWYAVGFIDFMMRGSDGNFVFFHRIRNSNVNTEAYMRTGNQPVRYEVTNESAKGQLLNSITASQTTIPLVDATDFPNETGVIMIDDELIRFNGKSGNTLINCTRSASLTYFVGGAIRSFTAGVAATHEFNTGVILVSTTVSPIISHWGSAMLTDGYFDEDRGYIFNYAATNTSVTTTKQTAFLIRLAPSVSNAIVGDLGDRELLNRAQLLLKGIEITADSGTGGIVVEGVLNPQNYPIDPSLIAWTGLQSSAVGGQPSFAQIAPGGSVTWNGGASQTTTPVTTQGVMTGSISARGESGFGFFGGYNYFYMRETEYQSAIANGMSIGDGISGTGIPSGTTFTGPGNTFNWNNILHRIVFISANTLSSQSSPASLTVTRSFKTSNTSTIFFQKASWESSGARTGTEVSDTLFPANTFVNGTSLVTFFSTQYYRITFSQTSTSTVINAGTTTVTFKFGQPPYALPGETVFSFIASPGSNSHLYLDELKELTNTTLGGRGCYPNGPDVLAINVYKASGAAISCNIVLRWSEAQA